jgi:uncharacterized membrane protein YhaH (DUF805 family)
VERGVAQSRHSGRLISGRATRSEYWFFFLFSTAIELIIVLIGFSIAKAVGAPPESAATGAEALLFIYLVVTLLPSLAVSVRRLHDVGMSGWWLLLSFVPLGGLALLVIYCLDSNPDANRYGPCPKDFGRPPPWRGASTRP